MYATCAALEDARLMQQAKLDGPEGIGDKNNPAAAEKQGQEEQEIDDPHAAL